MDKYREKVALRGTVDCPFQHYSLQRDLPNMTLTNAHWHPEYEIIYMRCGEVELKSDKQSFILADGEIAFINPGRLHSIITLADKNKYEAFVFSLDLLSLPQSHFFQKGVIDPIRDGSFQLPSILRKNDPQYIAVSQALDEITACSHTDPKRKQTIFLSMVKIFVTMSDRLSPCKTSAKQQSHETVKQTLAYLSQHYAEHLTLQQIAHQVHLHPNYLCSLFKDFTGHTVFHHLIGIRIENASQILKNESTSINDTAMACGFESASFFSKKFKEYMGCSPKEYRQQNR